jgi:putative aldouronate transport system substrate-binding protein
MKKVIAILLAVLMITTMLSGCGGTGKTDSDKTGGSGPVSTTGADSTDAPFEFTYTMQTKFVDWLKDLKWFPVAEKATNTKVILKGQGASETEYQSSIDQMLISKTFPDAGQVTARQAIVYGQQGAFVDLKPYIEQYAPNIKAYIEANPDYEDFITAEDGGIYGLAAECVKIGEFLFYRADHFKEAGITEMPRTLDEFTDILRKLKEHFKDEENYYPFSGREHYIRTQWIFNCYANFDGGVSNGLYDTMVLKEAGTDIYSEGYKKMIEWYRMLYEEELINPQWVEGAMTEQLWEQDFLTGKSSVGLDFFTRPAWFMNNGGPDNDPDYDVQVMDYLLDIDGNEAKIFCETRYKLDRSIAININSKDKAPGIIKFLDFFYSEEGQELVHWGVEGESFKKDGDKYEYIVDFNEQEALPLGTPRWSFLNDRLTFPKPVNNEWFYEWNSDVVKDAALRNFTQVEPSITFSYTAEQAKEYDNLKAVVTPQVLSGTIKFINGSRPMSEWDQWLDEMAELGYKRMEEIQQAAYDAKYKK